MVGISRNMQHEQAPLVAICSCRTGCGISSRMAKSHGSIGLMLPGQHAQEAVGFGIDLVFQDLANMHEQMLLDLGHRSEGVRSRA